MAETDREHLEMQTMRLLLGRRSTIRAEIGGQQRDEKTAPQRKFTKLDTNVKMKMRVVEKDSCVKKRQRISCRNKSYGKRSVARHEVYTSFNLESHNSQINNSCVNTRCPKLCKNDKKQTQSHVERAGHTREIGVHVTLAQ